MTLQENNGQDLDSEKPQDKWSHFFIKQTVRERRERGTCHLKDDFKTYQPTVMGESYSKDDLNKTN